MYETVWGGIVSNWAYEADDPRVEFGNVLYNDHHFHYGYWVYAAAIVASLDPAWYRNNTNRAWVESLVRDFANPTSDSYFPFSRMFDWYHGHSWASGFDPSPNGKNQESSSEDVFALYGVKLLGQVTGNAAMESRANLQLAILARSLRNYYLMDANNVNHPANFIGNRAVGIVGVLR